MRPNANLVRWIVIREGAVKIEAFRETEPGAREYAEEMALRDGGTYLIYEQVAKCSKCAVKWTEASS